MLSLYVKEESSLVLKATVPCDKQLAHGFLVSVLRDDVSEQETAGISVRGQTVYSGSAGQTACAAAPTPALHSRCRSPREGALLCSRKPLCTKAGVLVG